MTVPGGGGGGLPPIPGDFTHGKGNMPETANQSPFICNIQMEGP